MTYTICAGWQHHLTKNRSHFGKKIDEAATWKLYEVPTSGYFTTGVRPAIVAVDKRSFVNVVRLWIQPDAPKNGFSRSSRLTKTTLKQPACQTLR